MKYMEKLSINNFIILPIAGGEWNSGNKPEKLIIFKKIIIYYVQSAILGTVVEIRWTQTIKWIKITH